MQLNFFSSVEYTCLMHVTHVGGSGRLGTVTYPGRGLEVHRQALPPKDLSTLITCLSLQQCLFILF